MKPDAKTRILLVLIISIAATGMVFVTAEENTQKDAQLPEVDKTDLLLCGSMPVQEQSDISEKNATGPATISSEYAADEVIVRFKPTENDSPASEEAFYASAHAKVGAEITKDMSRFNLPEIQLVKLTGGLTVDEAISVYSENQDVLYAEPNYKLYPCEIPDDPYYNQLWAMKAINAPDAWDYTTGSDDVIVAVVDTGVDYTHPDLSENIWINTNEIPENGIDDDCNGYIDDYYGWDFHDNDPDPMDEYGHGTHCAGTIGAVGNNGIGVAGINWKTKIMPLRFLGNDDDGGCTFDGAQALLYADMMGASVISNSWGGGGYSQTMNNAISSSNAVVVCASGNDAMNTDTDPYYPSNYECDTIISVAASDSDGKIAYFSNYGTNSVDIAAPGVAIFSTVPKGEYEFYKGTSMAAPHVSGLAALIKSANPKLTNYEIIDLILKNANKLPGWDKFVKTGGQIDAIRCISSIKQDTVDAKFKLEPQEGKAPLTIQCTDISSGSPVSWVWDFGDYTEPSYEQNPEKTYSNANQYPITLQISDGKCTDATTLLVKVYPDAEFTADITSGDAPLTVEFSNESTGSPLELIWKFGDGETGYDENPSYTYTEPGTYTVSLYAERKGLLDQEIKAGYITVTNPEAELEADFKGEPLTGTAPLEVCFTDKSSGCPESWNWSFGDGEFSEEQDPVHKYCEPGDYTVSLTVSKGQDSATLTYIDYISVLSSDDYKLEFLKGWNFVATPKLLAEGHNTADIFSEIDSAGHSMMTFNGETQCWNIVSSDEPILPLFGYWIYSAEPVTVNLIFNDNPLIPPPVREVYKGWNTIGFTGTTPATARDTMLSVIDIWNYVIGYNSATQTYDDTIINGGTGEFSDERLMLPAKGYWAYMKEDGVLSAIGI